MASHIGLYSQVRSFNIHFYPPSSHPWDQRQNDAMTTTSYMCIGAYCLETISIGLDSTHLKLCLKVGSFHLVGAEVVDGFIIDTHDQENGFSAHFRTSHHLND